MSKEADFLQHMVIKGIWNSLVGLPLHVHGKSLGEYLDSEAVEIKGIIGESIQVAQKEYGIEFSSRSDEVWRIFVETTRHLRWIKRSGKAGSISARNTAIQTWGLKHGIPTPITDRLLSANSAL